MHPHSRARRILKWTGVGLSLVILAVWVSAGWWEVHLRLGEKTLVELNGGWIGAWQSEGVKRAFPRVLGWNRHVGRTRVFERPDFAWRDRWYLPAATLYISHIVIPFWLLLLLTTIPTAWLWHRDRRRIRPGHCARCGYDLTGNTSGVCSECGLPAAPGRAIAPAPEKSGR